MNSDAQQSNEVNASRTPMSGAPAGNWDITMERPKRRAHARPVRKKKPSVMERGWTSRQAFLKAFRRALMSPSLRLVSITFPPKRATADAKSPMVGCSATRTSAEVFGERGGEIIQTRVVQGDLAIGVRRTPQFRPVRVLPSVTHVAPPSWHTRHRDSSGPSAHRRTIETMAMIRGG